MYGRVLSQVSPRRSLSPAKHIETRPLRPTPHNDVLLLQTTCGNRAVGELIQSGQLQRKPNPRIAQHAGARNSIQRMFSTGAESDISRPTWLCTECRKQSAAAAVHKEETDDRVNRAASGSLQGAEEAPGGLESELRRLQLTGSPLPETERHFYEARFQARFSDTRIHTDDQADRLARALSADAFTIGNHIAFRHGRDQPEREAGQGLMAHELTHVLQQRDEGQIDYGKVQRTIGDGHDLASPRFALNQTLEAVFDNEVALRKGARGEPVRLIQDALLAMGYALPRSVSTTHAGRGDGAYEDETKAAIEQFQRDAGAASVDGVVGPETMGLLDTHDVARPGGRPPAITGPVAPPVAATDCDGHFSGATFALGNQTASGVTNSATIQITQIGGRDFLSMRGNAPINYDPEITITAPSNAAAANFRVGFVQNLLTSHRVATYSGGSTVSTVVPTLPIKDGDPNNYHPIFVTNPQATIVEDFATTGQQIVLNWPDVPADGKFINLLDNGTCAGAGHAAQTMTVMSMLDTFRIWVVVQHRPSGCVRSLHHVDWHLDWLAMVTGGVTPAVVPVTNVSIVTQPNGNGGPRFIQGGQVPGAIAAEQCT